MEGKREGEIETDDIEDMDNTNWEEETWCKEEEKTETDPEQ